MRGRVPLDDLYRKPVKGQSNIPICNISPNVHAQRRKVNKEPKNQKQEITNLKIQTKKNQKIGNQENQKFKYQGIEIAGQNSYPVPSRKIRKRKS